MTFTEPPTLIYPAQSGCDAPTTELCGDSHECRYGYCVKYPHICDCDRPERKNLTVCEFQDTNCVVPTGSPEEVPGWMWWPVGLCAFAVLVVLIVIIVAACLIWRYRRVICRAMVSHCARGETTEGVFDAYISHSDAQNDLRFVAHVLRIRLQRMGFKLCLSFRNFRAGAAKADCILEAVEKSHRVILLVSPDYVLSEWPVLEYQVAQKAMLNKKNNIVPIMYGDIGDHRQRMDRNLQHILVSTLCICWPGEGDRNKLERFWRQVKRSLPERPIKKVGLEAETSFSGNAGSVGTSTRVSSSSASSSSSSPSTSSESAFSTSSFSSSGSSSFTSRTSTRYSSSSQLEYLVDVHDDDNVFYDDNRLRLRHTSASPLSSDSDQLG